MLLRLLQKELKILMNFMFRFLMKKDVYKVQDVWTAEYRSVSRE